MKQKFKLFSFNYLCLGSFIIYLFVLLDRSDGKTEGGSQVCAFDLF